MKACIVAEVRPCKFLCQFVELLLDLASAVGSIPVRLMLAFIVSQRRIVAELRT